MICVSNYPFSKNVLWDKPNIVYIDENELFYLIEKRWRYIDHDNLSGNETALIERLMWEYGNGVILKG